MTFQAYRNGFVLKISVINFLFFVFKVTNTTKMKHIFTKLERVKRHLTIVHSHAEPRVSYIPLVGAE